MSELILPRRGLLKGAAALAAFAALPSAPAEGWIIPFEPTWSPFVPGALGAATIAACFDSRDASLMTFEAGNRITSWKDRIGGVVITATSGSTARPTYLGTTAFAGTPSVAFDGVANCLRTASLGNIPSGTTPGTKLMAGANAVGSAAIKLFSQTGGSGGVAPNLRSMQTTTGNSFNISDGTTGYTFSGSNIGTSPWIWEANWDGQNMNQWLNGIAGPTNPKALTQSINTLGTRFSLGSNAATTAGAFQASEVKVHFEIIGDLLSPYRQRLNSWVQWTFFPS